jgi:SAM-dependent methyltransferase
MSDPPFEPEHFRRMDEAEDAAFYAMPRLVTHIDDHAIEAIRQLYAELLPPGGAVLDLMSSWVSHLPEDVEFGRVVGLGMNDEELRQNPRLDARVVHDLNAESTLPFEDAAFDAAVVAVSVQYLTSPIDVFRDVRRVLRPGAPFVVTFSNRLFPEKAIALWQMCSDEQRARLVGAYFHYAGGWDAITAQDRSPKLLVPSDPLFAVWAVAALDGEG